MARHVQRETCPQRSRPGRTLRTSTTTAPTTFTTELYKKPKQCLRLLTELQRAKRPSSVAAQTALPNSRPLPEGRTRQRTCTTVRLSSPLCIVRSTHLFVDPPLATLPREGSTTLEQFVGEESMLPTPPTTSTPPRTQSSASPFAGFGMPTSAAADPSIWTEEQQARLLNALMAGAAAHARDSNSSPALEDNQGPLPEGDPLAAFMSMMGQPGEKGGLPPNMFAPPPPLSVPARRTTLQKVMPIVHILAGWLLLAYFVLWKEPQAYEARPHAFDTLDGRWRRWAELGWQGPNENSGVQLVVRRAL